MVNLFCPVAEAADDEDRERPAMLFRYEVKLCGVVVVEDDLRTAIDIVLQPANQNVESRFGGEFRHEFSLL